MAAAVLRCCAFPLQAFPSLYSKQEKPSPRSDQTFYEACFVKIIFDWDPAWPSVTGLGSCIEKKYLTQDSRNRCTAALAAQ